MAHFSESDLIMLCCLVVLPFLLYFFIFKKPFILPPGPTPWPVLGNFQYMKTMTPLTLASLAQKYGPLMSLRLGTSLIVVGSSPIAAAEILKTKDRVLSARSVPSSVPMTRQEIERLSFWADPSAVNWKNIRAICRAELFSGKSLEAQSRMRERKVTEMVEYLRAKEDEVVDVERCVFVTVVNMFSNAFFSRDVLRFVDEEEADKVRGLLRGIIRAIATQNFSDFYPVVARLDPQGLRKMHRELSMEMHGLWRTIVEERRRLGDSSNQDFLDSLLDNGFTDTQIHKLIEELFQAGIDTTTSTINRTVAELLNQPEHMKKLRRELGPAFDQDLSKTSNLIMQLPYLQACLKETLRLHPPAPFLLPHRAQETCQVLNYTVPKDARVLVNVWAIGRDPTVWQDPLEYRPERFLGSELDFKGSDFEFLPFGAGRRICPGLPMAANIVPSVVAALVYFLDWSLPQWTDPGGYETLRATSQMVQPLKLIPKARKFV